MDSPQPMANPTLPTKAEEAVALSQTTADSSSSTNAEPAVAVSPPTADRSSSTKAEGAGDLPQTTTNLPPPTKGERAKNRSWNAKTFTDVCDRLKAAAKQLPWPVCSPCPLTDEPGPRSMTTRPISEARDALWPVLRSYRVNKADAAKQIETLLDSTEAKLREYRRDVKSRYCELVSLVGVHDKNSRCCELESCLFDSHAEAMAQAREETQMQARVAITSLVDVLEVCAETAADNDQSLLLTQMTCDAAKFVKDELAKDGAKQAGGSGDKRRNTGKRSKDKPLTTKQRDAVEMLMRCEVNKTEAAKRLGITRSSLDDRLRGAKLRSDLALNRSVAARALPKDKRRQVLVSSPKIKSDDE